MFFLKTILIYLALFLIIISVSGCKKSPDIDFIVEQELLKKEINNNLILGLKFRMDIRQVDSLFRNSPNFFGGKDFFSGKEEGALVCLVVNDKHNPILANASTHYHNNKLSEFHFLIPTKKEDATDARRLVNYIKNIFGEPKINEDIDDYDLCTAIWINGNRKIELVSLGAIGLIHLKFIDISIIKDKNQNEFNSSLSNSAN